MACQMLCEELKGRFPVALSEDCILLAQEDIPDHLEETHRSFLSLGLNSDPRKKGQRERQDFERFWSEAQHTTKAHISTGCLISTVGALLTASSLPKLTVSRNAELRE